MDEFYIGELIIDEEVFIGKLELDSEKISPKLENIRIKPSKKEQIFNHPNSFGYDEIFVEAVDGNELIVKPTTEEQVYEGLFDQVIVEKVTSDIDKNIRSEIIRENEEILGVVGSYKGIDTSDATAASDDILKDKTAYVNGHKIDGTIEDYDGSWVGNASYISELELSFISTIDNSKGENVTKLPDGITIIGDYAFQYRKNLKITELPDNLTTIGQYAFYGCNNLALTELPDNLTTIGQYAFQDCIKLAFTKLPDNLIEISNRVFYNCTNLTLTELPKNISKIGTHVFYKCTNLALTEIPECIKTITTSLFAYCVGLKSLDIKGQLTKIDATAFAECTNLAKIILSDVTNVTSLSNINVFQGTPIANGTGYIYVPDNLVDSFKTATNWSTYASQIKPISEMEG